MAPRETENNAYAKFWGDKQRALWYAGAHLMGSWVCYGIFWCGQYRERYFNQLNV